MALEDYNHPYVTVDLLLFSVIDNNLAICLTKRDQEPFKDQYSLPGTFIHEDESAEGAVDRLLKNKLSLPDSIYTEQMQTFSDIHRDPRDRVISIAYIGIIPDMNMVDVPWMKWFTIGQSNVGTYRLVPVRDGSFNSNKAGSSQSDSNGSPAIDSFLSSNLGFDHDRMLGIAIERLRSKVDYTDLIFRFLKDTKCFTSQGLRELYQAVIGREINRGNFTKYQMNTYIEHGLINKTGSVVVGRGRPADTYSYIGGGKLWIKY